MNKKPLFPHRFRGRLRGGNRVQLRGFDGRPLPASTVSPTPAPTIGTHNPLTRRTKLPRVIGWPYPWFREVPLPRYGPAR